MAQVESEFVRHIPCLECGSSDANSLYSDGHTFCFKCHHRTNGDYTPDHTTMPVQEITLRGQAERLKKRRIPVQVCERYKIYRDGDELIFHYFDENNRLIGRKIKTKDKQFRYEGKSDGRLFGQNLWPSHGKRVVVFEGELDAASGAAAMPGWPMVSLPQGAAGAKRSIQKSIEWFQGYQEIVLFPDNDEAGQKALQEMASVLPPGKVKVAHLPDYKDASDALQADDFEAVRLAIITANPYRPDGIVEAKSLYDVVTNEEDPCLHAYPFEGLQQKTHGIRLGELVCVTAGTGIGKSSICRQLATDLLQKGERVGYLALEESNRRTALGLMSVAKEKAYHIGKHERTDLAEAFNSTIAGWNLYLYDGWGSVDPDIIFNRVEYLATGLDCRVIFVDHLSILISGLDGDERRMIDQTMTKLRSLVERTGISLFLVSHLRRTQSDHNHEEGARTSIGQLRGSAAIAQLSDIVIGLERNQQSKSSENATTVRVLKNRFTGETGEAGVLTYDVNTCKFKESETQTQYFDAYGTEEAENTDF
jgi:twinkle protein